MKFRGVFKGIRVQLECEYLPGHGEIFSISNMTNLFSENKYQGVREFMNKVGFQKIYQEMAYSGYSIVMIGDEWSSM